MKMKVQVNFGETSFVHLYCSITSLIFFSLFLYSVLFCTLIQNHPPNLFHPIETNWNYWLDLPPVPRNYPLYSHHMNIFYVHLNRNYPHVWKYYNFFGGKKSLEFKNNVFYTFGFLQPGKLMVFSLSKWWKKEEFICTLGVLARNGSLTLQMSGDLAKPR